MNLVSDNLVLLTEEQFNMKRLEYLRKNKSLIEVLLNFYGKDGLGLNYEEIVEALEEKEESIPGLMIKLERGVVLRLITHDEAPALSYRKYLLEEGAIKLYESIDFIYNLRDAVKKRSRERIKEKTRYIV